MPAPRLLPPLLACALTGCAAAFAPAVPSWPKLPNGHFMHVGDFLQVTGVGKAPANVKSETQMKSESRDQAILDGWERLRSYLEDLPLPGGGTVGSRAEADPKEAELLQKLVYGAQVVETKWSGNSAAAVMRLSKTRVNAVLRTEFR